LGLEQKCVQRLADVQVAVVVNESPVSKSVMKQLTPERTISASVSWLILAIR
jgi:hypothetical protein